MFLFLSSAQLFSGKQVPEASAHAKKSGGVISQSLTGAAIPTRHKSYARAHSESTRFNLEIVDTNGAMRYLLRDAYCPYHRSAPRFQCAHVQDN
jgi:hypothetical protein